MIVKKHYSGRNSKRFWKRINSIKDESKWSEAYSLGVVLQETEELIIKILKNINGK